MQSWLRVDEPEWSWRPGPAPRRARRAVPPRRPRWRTVALASLLAAATAAIAVVASSGAGPAAADLDASRPAPAWASRSLAHDARLLDALVMCESRGQAAVVSRDGLYGGLFQFDQATWRSVGGAGSPSSAPPSEQRARALLLLLQRGVAPWPRCGPAAAARST